MRNDKKKERQEAELQEINQKKEAEAKEQARRSWIGDDDSFEQEWPSLWTEIRRQLVFEQRDEMQATARQAVRNLL